MSSDSDKMIVTRLYDRVINLGLFAEVEDLIAPGYIQHTVLGFGSGRGSFEHFFTHVRHEFPDAKVTILDIASGNDRVAVRYRFNLTYKVKLPFVTINKRLTLRGVDAFRLSEGRIVEHWDTINFSSAILKLGPIGVIQARRTLTRLSRAASLSA